jgi:hypothetical protein
MGGGRGKGEKKNKITFIRILNLNKIVFSIKKINFPIY